MQGWYDGSAPLAGLTVDADLRWALLNALAAAGRADDAAIDAELERDNTISGRERAAAARTVMPTAEAKEAAWQAAVERDDVPNETQRQIAVQLPGGRPGGACCGRSSSATSRSPRRSGRSSASSAPAMVLQHLFPRALADRPTLDRVNEWLATTQANPAALRYVREGASDLERALAAQERDAA